TGPITGELVWLGRACTLTGGDTLENAAALDDGDIAVVRRGACEFEEKTLAAATAGAAGVIIANNL
ncbi:MAG: amidohydrolase, partial [Thermoplasmata archaeon]|nr:amidohydrolase [Thermoplasmata archaeon]NIS20161.1 amidohydrolase [Thermoplasmata archaeon]NIT77489.1 amidohydrolase [Thermoplasmata archaeon]NIU49259.1 amidohydrolase [Thermoplasmata archaeon]NIW82756.1 amidohydrolase [Thermoplasmata archaeon]